MSQMRDNEAYNTLASPTPKTPNPLVEDVESPCHKTNEGDAAGMSRATKAIEDAS